MSIEAQANQFVVEDEISLIDLVRILLRRKVLLMGTFVSGTILAIGAAMLYEQQFLYSASIEVGSVSDMQGDTSQVESTNAVLSKLQESIIPAVLADFTNSTGGSKVPSINAHSPRNSELLVIEGKGRRSQAEAIVELENTILARLKEQQASLYELEKMDIVNALVDKDAQLREEKALQNSLEAALVRTEKLYQLRLNQLKENESNINRLITTRSKLGKGDNAVLAQLLVDAELEKAQRMRLELEQTVNLDLPAARDDLQRQIEISVRKQAGLEADIVKTKLLLENVKETRFVNEPGANPVPTGVSKKAIIAVGGLLSAMLAILAVFLAEFIVRIRQELAEKSAG